MLTYLLKKNLVLDQQPSTNFYSDYIVTGILVNDTSNQFSPFMRIVNHNENSSISTAVERIQLRYGKLIEQEQFVNQVQNCF